MKVDLLTLDDFSAKELLSIITLAQTIKKNKKKYSKALYEKVLVMMFEKPSLRTRLSFDAAMTQLGGHAIFYDTSHSPLHAGKETISDMATVIGRMSDGIMARTYSHENLEEFAKYSRVPVINGLTNFSHPCQILGDLLTIKEKKKTVKPTIAYYGDCNNNVTHSLMFAANKLKFSLTLVCPKSNTYMPNPGVLETTKKYVTLIHRPKDVPKTDVVYTDSWMSYQIPKYQQFRRKKALKRYQVNQEAMKRAKKNAIFMHDLPALRGMEVHEDVIDGKQSVIFDQAENRLHIEKAILVYLLK
jgi:ornithine carbamoyltransferase